MVRKPKISVIVAVYNGGKTLQRCITSAATQSYLNKELIIIDGGSTDNSVEILRANTAEIAYWESKPDRGIYHAWNKALDHACGDWICFLGADDYFWGSDVLERMASRLVDIPPDVRVVYGLVASVNDHGEVLRFVGESWVLAKQKIYSHMSIPHAGTMHHCSIFDSHGKFDESFRIAGDYELLLRELKTLDAVFIPDTIVLGMQYGGISCDTEFLTTILIEEARARRKNKIKPISFQWTKSYLKALLRTMFRRIIGERGVRYLSIFRGRLTGHPSVWEQLPAVDKTRRPNVR